MHYAVAMFATDYAIRPDRLARELEERGFESLWLPEHTHIPASRRSPWPGGADLPKEYWHTYDPFVALTAAAWLTTNSSVYRHRRSSNGSIKQRKRSQPYQLSHGRFILESEALERRGDENHGTTSRRWRIARRVLAMKSYLPEEADFHGDFVNFDPIGRP